MENLDKSRKDTSALSEKTVAEVLRVPFEPLTLRRPMQLFKGTLGLVPGVAMIPDSEFLCRLSTGRTLQALVRREAGNSYKSLENLIRGKNKSSEKTRSNLSAVLGLTDEDLLKLVHGNRDGPLLPSYLEVFQLFEGAAHLFYGLLTSRVVRCRCCNENILADIDPWWNSQALRLGAPEYRFVERLLNAILGGYLIRMVFKPPAEKDLAIVRPLSALCNPKRHPIGNWMHLLENHYSCKYQWELPVRLPVSQGEDEDEIISYGRIRKWSSGGELIPVAAATNMSAEMSNPSYIGDLHLAARTMALAIDFISSTAEGEYAPSREEAQKIVYERLKLLEQKILLSQKLGAAR